MLLEIREVLEVFLGNMGIQIPSGWPQRLSVLLCRKYCAPAIVIVSIPLVIVLPRCAIMV